MNSISWLKEFVLSISKYSTYHALQNTYVKTANISQDEELIDLKRLKVGMTLSAESIVKTTLTPILLQRLGAHNPDIWAPPLIEACISYNITTPARIAGFLSNVLVESASFSSLTENFNYTPMTLQRQWPVHFNAFTAQQLGRTANHPADQKKIAEYAYGGRMGNGPMGCGDGWLYRGRGIIQLTGKQSYQMIADLIKIDVLELTHSLENPEVASKAAAAFWNHVGCNQFSDKLDMKEVRRLINGGLIGLDQVNVCYKTACAILNIG